MPGDDDLIEAAKSIAVDYYDLLGITFENSSESDIRRAYRRTALKYHPDKNADKPDIVEKFHLLQIANDVLSSPEYKAIYDNARRVKQEKEERHQAFEGRRRQMKEDLENRENAGLKRKHQEEEEGDKLQREIQRLSAEGKRRRLERQDQLNRERLEEEERLDRERDGYISPQQTAPNGSTGVPDIDRSVKVVWYKEGPGATIDKDRLEIMFTKFGKIQGVAMLKDKKKRIGESKSKSLVASALIVFESVVGAHAAVFDYKKRSESDADFKALDSVYWASNKEPDFVQRLSTPVPTTPSSAKPSPQRPLQDLSDINSPTTPLKQSSDGPGLRKVPSFASFSSAKNSPVAPSAQSPSLEERTMIRLKIAEKRRLEELIRKEEAGEDDD